MPEHLPLPPKNTVVDIRHLGPNPISNLIRNTNSDLNNVTLTPNLNSPNPNPNNSNLNSTGWDKNVSCTFFVVSMFWPSAQSARDNHVLACNFAKHSPILIFFTHRLSNKPYLIWLLTTPHYLKYVVGLPCNFSLMACFADINVSLTFYKVM